MSEGGVYPWKRQRPDGVVYTDYTQILKPLPPPPDGLMWVKRRVTAAEQEQLEEQEQQDGNAGVNGNGDEPVAVVAEVMSSSSEARFMWELVERPMRPGPEEGGEEPPLVDLGEEEEEEGQADFILHTVLPTDTMAGLRLRYKVTAAELRKHNDFAGELFHVLDTLRVPISGREEHVKQFKQRPTKEVIRQRFANATRCHDKEMQTYYLEANEWNLAAAVRECEEDRKWEEEYGASQHMARVPVAQPPPAPDTSVPVQQQQQQPPPSYASFFKVKNLRSANNRPSNYFPWPTASPLRGRHQQRQGLAYDMDAFAPASYGDVGSDYVRIDGPEGTNEPLPVAVLAPQHEDSAGELHEAAALRAPLLGRRGSGSGAE